MYLMIRTIKNCVQENATNFEKKIAGFSSDTVASVDALDTFFLSHFVLVLLHKSGFITPIITVKASVSIQTGQ